MSPTRVLRGLLFGGIGGFIGWFLIEFLPFPYPFRPHTVELPNAEIPLTRPDQQGLLGMVLGLAIGALLGLSEGIGEGTAARFRRALALFLVVGLFGGFLGLYFGQILFAALGGKVDAQTAHIGEFFTQVIVRGLGWLMIGLFLGLALGGPNLSVRRMINGALGGAIGGFIGGVLFQLMTFSGLFVGMQARLIGFTILGAAIGFFINLIAEAMKRIWVKVLVGRNEGREHVLDTPIAYVGRDELADIPVFLDPVIPRRMASFRRTGGRYALYPEADQPPILVNGQALAPGQVLRDGDAIQFGRVTLGYYERATATGASRPVDRLPASAFSPAAGAAPVPPGACEFCGQPRDPATGACACSVAAPPIAGYDAATAYGHPGASEYPGAAPGYGAAPSAPPGTAILAGLIGPWAGHAIALNAIEIGIGREDGQDIQLTGDATASRRHAALSLGPVGWTIRDLGSSNGTWVNGARIQEQVLVPGDVIRIGQSEFRFEG